MELSLQFGYGMMEHCRALLSRWGGGTAILSPRDLNAEQLERLAGILTSLQATSVLFDPQFYLPHADHERLCSHGYWPKEYETTDFFEGPALASLLSELHSLNLKLRTSELVFPGIFATSVDDDWLESQRAVIHQARATISDMPLMGTIALSGDAVRNQEQIGLLLDRAESWKLPSYYLVCEHPKGQYLVDDPIWVANVMDVAAGLRLLGSKVVLGYCSHQMLAAAVAHASAIASGTWMNVRSFPPEKFKAVYEDEIRQRSTWYYCPQALSEYKLPFLDVAKEFGLLDSMKSSSDLDDGHVEVLFSGAQPSTVRFTEQMAFRHYLHCLHGQAMARTFSTFDATRSAYMEMLDVAVNLLQSLSSSGIRGQLREFTDIVDVNRAAVEVFTKRRGSMLRRKWATL
jgi:hypothetical protein